VGETSATVDGRTSSRRASAERTWAVPLSPYGAREICVIAVVTLIAVGVLAYLWGPGAAIAAAAGVALLAFFRDPRRVVPDDPSALLAPADGKVTEITQIADEPLVGGGPAVKIGIFLSVFDVHLNRSPCRGAIRSMEHRPGVFRNAMSARSSHDNESNTLVLDAGGGWGDVGVKQIAGLIARRIVCAAEVGETLEAGQRFGMIKFGSRTELYVGRPEQLDVVVRLGDAVRAGQTVLIRRR
jgi:phosphatidylserine decarboxylase